MICSLVVVAVFFLTFSVHYLIFFRDGKEAICEQVIHTRLVTNLYTKVTIRLYTFI